VMASTAKYAGSRGDRLQETNQDTSVINNLSTELPRLR
jgi:hypothetical protein